MIDAGYILARSAIRPAASDPLGLAVYSQIGRPKVDVAGAVATPCDGVSLAGWWADRCRVDLYGISAPQGATLRLKLLVGNQVASDDWVTVLNRSIVVPPGTNSLSLTLGTGSGWLGSFFILVGEVLVAEECSFAARYTLDRIGAGLYSAGGDGTLP